MSVMKALESPEIIYTRDGKKRATHEAYSYHITPYQNPPVKLEVVKGFIDKNGQFLAIPTSTRIVDITLTEFRELISPTPQGKPAGDFRLSDVLGVIRRRTVVPAAVPAAAPAPAEPAASDPAKAVAEPGKEASPEEAPKEAAVA